MPLRAIINGEDVLAPSLGDDAWENLKTRIKREKLAVRLPCCENPVKLRTSHRGLHHFAHKKLGDCTSQRETWQHLKAKYEIVRACHDAGYDATTEVAGDGWRADVLATKDTTKGANKIAFEVQWSSQTWEETQERQQRYKEAGIRGCWFFKTPPPQYQYSPTDEVPLFKLDVTDEACTVIFKERYEYIWYSPDGDKLRKESRHHLVPLSDFVNALLTSRIRFCATLRAQRCQKVCIVFVEVECQKCHKLFHVYYTPDCFTTACGETIHSDIEFAPQIISLALGFTRSPEGQHLKLNFIKEYSFSYEGKLYLNWKFGCPYCSSGNYDRHKDKLTTSFEIEIDLARIVTEGYSHWCFPDNGQFCCE